MEKIEFQNIEEKIFWRDVFVASFNSNYEDSHSKIADIAILELREREKPAYMVGVLKQEISKEET